jgi:hypothetical protein
MRKLAIWLAAVTLPCQFHVDDQHVAEAETILEQGNGLIILMNHFSMRDALQVTSWLFRHRVASRRRIVAPVAFHQDGFVIRVMSNLVAIELCPIVTSRTEELGAGGKRRGSGIRDYLNTAVETLKHGGMVLVAPQGSRKSQLGEPVGHPVGNIISWAKRKGAQNLGTWCFGLGITGATSYDKKKVSGSNFFRRFDLRIGKPYIAEEAIEIAGGIDMVDTWVFDQLAELVPEAYRGTALIEPDESSSEESTIGLDETGPYPEASELPQKP